MRARILLLLPLGLALGGCYTMDTPYSYGHPASPYGYAPAPHYAYGNTPYGYAPYPAYPAGQPAVVAPRTYQYVPAPAVSQYDYDRDGVHNSADRFPSDPRRW